MISAYRARLYRLIFWLAAIYNLAFGLWACLWPEAFFSWTEIAQPNYPALWQCLGMVVGLYGILYASAARDLQRARLVIAVGLLGKILGPIGFLLTTAAGQWPMRAVTLIVFNDFVWWLPFSLFLLDPTRLGKALRASAPWFCLAAHVAAGIGLLLIAGRDSAGLAFAFAHLPLWRANWAVWMCASISLVAFYAWWGAWAPPRPAIIAVCTSIAGLGCDLFAESLLLGWPANRLVAIEPMALMLSGVVANSCYTAAGIILTLTTPNLRRWQWIWAWLIWLSGIALTISTVLNASPIMAIAIASLFFFLLPWVALLGWQLPSRSQR